MPLEELDCADAKVTNLAPLKESPTLKTLRCDFKLARDAVQKILPSPDGPQGALVAINPSDGSVLAMVADAAPVGTYISANEDESF